MKFSRSTQIALSALSGLALALVGKFIYDLFNGFATIPNLFLSLGIDPPRFVLDALLLVSLTSLAFGVGTLLFKKLSISPSHSATLAALPWVTLSLLGIAAGLLSESGPLLRELFASSPSAFLQSVLDILAVPTGLWLATRRSSHPREA